MERKITEGEKERKRLTFSGKKFVHLLFIRNG